MCLRWLHLWRIPPALIVIVEPTGVLRRAFWRAKHAEMSARAIVLAYGLFIRHDSVSNNRRNKHLSPLLTK